MKDGCGITVKIDSQIKALEKYFQVESIACPTIKSKKYLTLIFSLYRIFKLFILQGSNVVYIRNFTGAIGVFLFFALILNRRMKVIVEVPTYPIETNKSIVNLIDKTIKVFFYRFLVDEVLYIGSYSPSKIWGVKSKLFNNGVDLDKIPLKKELPSKDLGINFIGLATLTYWHGYDRLIRSIKHYKSFKLTFTIVGNGPELANLRKLVNQLGLESKIFFVGYKESKELDLLFNECQIAVDSLGRHRSGHDVNFSLKSREYTARGIPFIYSHTDYFFNNCKFAFKVDNDESLIDIPNIINWYRLNDLSAVSIRNYAEENFSWIEIYRKHFKDCI
jgi:glycosyltransferase involved in cell wall biosynthesis